MPNIFTPDHLAKIISETLPALKPGTNNMIIGTVDTRGAQVVASLSRTSGPLNWELQAAARHDWGGDTSAEAKVLLQW